MKDLECSHDMNRRRRLWQRGAGIALLIAVAAAQGSETATVNDTSMLTRAAMQSILDDLNRALELSRATDLSEDPEVRLQIADLISGIGKQVDAVGRHVPDAREAFGDYGAALGKLAERMRAEPAWSGRTAVRNELRQVVQLCSGCHASQSDGLLDGTDTSAEPAKAKTL